MLLVAEKWPYADRGQGFIEDVTCSGYFCPCCFGPGDGEIRGVHLGEFICATKSLAGGTPSNRGNDGSTHIFVRSRQHTEMFTRKPQIRTRKNVRPFPHGRSQGLKRELTGAGAEPIPFGPRSTSRQMMMCSKTLSTTSAAEGARPPSPRYRARLSFRIALVLDASHHATPTLLGEVHVHRRHFAEAAVMIDAEVDRIRGHQRALPTDGGDPPRPAEETLRCVRAPRRTEWIPARRVGILRPCAVPVVGGTSRLHKRLGRPCQPAPNSGHRQPPVRSAWARPTSISWAHF
jgi:hypothetical protein